MNSDLSGNSSFKIAGTFDFLHWNDKQTAIAKYLYILLNNDRMKNTNDNIDDLTIRNVGLKISNKAINANLSLNSRIFEYPHLENVYVMESDLYGNPMPKDSCFLAFNGRHGLVGKHLTIQVLLNSSVADIKHIVDSNTEG